MIQMSFSSNTKEELARIVPESTCCQLAELSALIRMTGSIKRNQVEGMTLTMTTENPSIARKMFRLIKMINGHQAEIQIRKMPRFNQSKQYIILVRNVSSARQILMETGVLSSGSEDVSIASEKPVSLLKKRCCRRSFLRGAFLGGGSISAPEKNYHLEFVSANADHLHLIQDLLQQFNLTGRQISRKNNYVLYLKEGEQIVDLLNVMGAHQALLSLENIRIMKQMRNSVNRVVNCETANLSKTVQASMRQMQMIEFIDKRVGVQNLPAALRDVAVARVKYPEASLKELGDLLVPPVGKSGINHRFRKLEQLERKLKLKRK